MTGVAVQVLAKPPIPGRVNTRLEAVLGRVGSARLARAQLERTLGVAVASGVGPVTLRVAGGPWHPFTRACAALHGVRLAPQPGRDLGERMAWAVRDGLAANRAVLLLGTDCPELQSSDLQEAVSRIENGADVVLGPAPDGGYYLAGLARPAPVMFRGMAWGSDAVLDRTLRRLRGAGFRVALLAPRRDLDRPVDLDGSPFRIGLGAIAQDG